MKRISWLSQDRTSEERLFRDTVRRFVEETVNPHERESRKSYADVTKKLYGEAGKHGILGVSIPERLGGQGGTAVMQGIAREELGRSLVIGYGLPFPLSATHINFADGCGRDVVKSWMPKFLSGDARLGIASTEPKSGSDVATITTRAVRSEDGSSFVLSGEKGPMSSIKTKDAFIVLARTDETGSGSKGISEFFVEGDRAGIEKFGFDSMEDSADLGGFRLHDVEVPSDHLLGAENSGFRQQMRAFDTERVMIPMSYLGAAMDSLDLSVEYAKNRVVWGRPIAAFEGVMFPIVEAITRVETVRSFCYDILRRYDRGEAVGKDGRAGLTKESSMARWYVTRVVLDALDSCIQVNGAQGYTDGVPHQRRYRWVRAGLFGHGTQEILKLVIGREVMGREIYEAALGRNRATTTTPREPEARGLVNVKHSPERLNSG